MNPAIVTRAKVLNTRLACYGWTGTVLTPEEEWRTGVPVRGSRVPDRRCLCKPIEARGRVAIFSSVRIVCFRRDGRSRVHAALSIHSGRRISIGWGRMSDVCPLCTNSIRETWGICTVPLWEGFRICWYCFNRPHRRHSILQKMFDK